MRYRPELFGHGEAVLPEAALASWDRKMQGVPEIGARQRNGEREVEARSVELVDGDDHEGP